MSGGHFDYNQYRLNDIAEEIEKIIKSDEYQYRFNKSTLDEFKEGLELILKARVYADRIDWLVSADDGEETFHKRLKEDLLELKNKKI